MADTQNSVITAAQAADTTALHRMREVASVGGTFATAADRERFFHNVRVQLAVSLGVGARAMNVDFHEPY